MSKLFDIVFDENSKISDKQNYKQNTESIKDKITENDETNKFPDDIATTMTIPKGTTLFHATYDIAVFSVTKFKLTDSTTAFFTPNEDYAYKLIAECTKFTKEEKESEINVKNQEPLGYIHKFIVQEDIPNILKLDLNELEVNVKLVKNQYCGIPESKNNTTYNGVAWLNTYDKSAETSKMCIALCDPTRWLVKDGVSGFVNKRKCIAPNVLGTPY